MKTTRTLSPEIARLFAESEKIHADALAHYAEKQARERRRDLNAAARQRHAHVYTLRRADGAR